MQHRESRLSGQVPLFERGEVQPGIDAKNGKGYSLFEAYGAVTSAQTKEHAIGGHVSRSMRLGGMCRGACEHTEGEHAGP